MIRTFFIKDVKLSVKMYVYSN